jgi:hypothetical protein
MPVRYVHVEDVRCWHIFMKFKTRIIGNTLKINVSILYPRPSRFRESIDMFCSCIKRGVKQKMNMEHCCNVSGRTVMRELHCFCSGLVLREVLS